jgi:hypothetical protein
MPLHPIDSGFIVGNAQAGMQSLSTGFVRAKAASGAAGLLLDDYPTANVAYSFRKLRDAYAGSAVRIRRSSDDAQADIGFSGNDFDTAAAAAHIGGGSGFIVTWYDQSGNGRNVTNATAANQPTYSATGFSSLPTASFDGTDTLERASTTTASLFETQVTILSAVQQTGTANQRAFLGFNGSNFLVWLTFDNTIYFDFGGTGGSARLNVAQPVGWDDDEHILELYRDSSDLQGIVVDGVSLATGTRTTDLTSTTATFVLGGNDTTADFIGLLSEFVIWPTDLGTTNRAGARNNMNAYWSAF